MSKKNLCPACGQLVDTDTISPWWMDHQKLAELHAYLTSAECPESDRLDPTQVTYFLQKPWKWSEERQRMIESVGVS